MRDRQPLPAELVRHRHRAAELLPEVSEIDGAQVVHRSAFSDHTMRLALEAHEVGLAQDGGVHIIQLLHQQTAPHRLVPLLAHQGIGQDPLAEHRRGFGKRQGRMERKDRMVTGQHPMHRVPELMRECGDVADVAFEIQQHVRRLARKDTVAIGTADLAGADGRIHMPLVQNARRECLHLR